ncbi:MAG: AI-2E family transporter [Rickettsiales bacterium]|nr:AI-2E family transporter [Rickettsiales bacterium]
MKQTYLLWTFVTLGLCGLLYLCWGIFTPFVVSLVIAYLWTPAASFIESKWQIPRWIISLGLVAITIGILLSIILVLLPLIYYQVFNFIQLAPNYKQFINQKVIPFAMEKLGSIAPEYISYVKTSIANLFSASFESIIGFVKKIWSSGFVIVDLLWFILLVPFITFHLIKDWQKITTHIKKAVPVAKQNFVNQISSDINHMITGVIRGQFNVCLIYAIYYTIALSILGLNYSVLLGITTGIVNFIPFVGIFIGWLAALIVTLLQFGSLKASLLTTSVFVLGVALDNGFISPRLIGKRVGLHPIWSIFFILFGGKLFGFIGMLIAIPLGASLMILMKIMLKFYYKSNLYSVKKIKVKRT